MCRCDLDGGIAVPLTVTAKSEGGYAVTSPVLPELKAEGATPEEALTNAQAAIGAVLDLYEEQGRPLPGHFH
ncbi:MAG: type II toxin-antitoxin system HicB family antitoxin [Terriglobia bacterium]